MDYGQFEALTFDCYGTLIDWETGILQGIRPVLAANGRPPDDDAILEAYARVEAELEAGPYRRYRDILSEAYRTVCRSFGFEPGDDAAAAFGGSVADWPAFSDSSAALTNLGQRFRLGVITNCDDDLFETSQRRLGTSFDWVVTAQAVGGYKPDERNFEVALRTIGLPRERVLHVAQSLFHDHVPAKRLGLQTVWIDRRRGRPGSGATPPATATPDAAYPDMASFAAAATA